MIGSFPVLISLNCYSSKRCLLQSQPISLLVWNTLDTTHKSLQVLDLTYKKFTSSLKNRKPLIIPIAFGWLLTGLLSAQAPVVYLSFSEGDAIQNKPLITPDQARYTVDLMRQKFSEGLTDYALDLSHDAMHRRPWVVDSNSMAAINLTESFSIQVWVKTKPGAALGTAIAGNKANDSLDAVGWQIFTQHNGAWALNLSDGNRQYNYLPTSKQLINDGDWHQLVFTVERPKNEARMYYDGRCVAIYNLEQLGDLTSSKRTVVGGSDEYFEWGSEGQWKAFNGYLDEVKFWDRKISAREVQESWNAFFPAEESPVPIPPQALKVMTWNIWHGGRRYGEQVGVERTIELIQGSQSDIICMIETYGSGPMIADALGYYFYLISSNLSIMSRYPITETIEIFRPFNAGGAVVELSPGVELVVFDIWLHYLPNYLKQVSDGTHSAEDLIHGEKETRAGEIEEILSEVKPWLVNNDVQGVVMAGDFNSGSHLDWILETKPLHHNYVVEWPVSKAMIEAGFIDSFRKLHINPLTDPGYTWTPRAATSSYLYGLRDRIDYIYYLGKIVPVSSKVVDYHPIMFPSDHAAVVTVFQVH